MKEKDLSFFLWLFSQTSYRRREKNLKIGRGGQTIEKCHPPPHTRTVVVALFDQAEKGKIWKLPPYL